MLAIRLQRTGRKGHAQFRVIVQESRRSPSSGNIVASLGSYDPHTKAITLDKEKAATFLTNGAQPSPRVVSLLQKEGVNLPSWVKVDMGRQRAIKNTDKLRRNQTPEPVEAISEETAEADAEIVAEPTEAPAEVVEVVTETTPETDEVAPEAESAPAEEPSEQAPKKA